MVRHWRAVVVLGLALGMGLAGRPVRAEDPGEDEKAIVEIEKQLRALQEAVAKLKKPEKAADEGPQRVVATRPAEKSPAATTREAAGTKEAEDPVARIRDEGMNRSQVMETLSYLTDVIGARLTGSPNLKRANEWTRTKLEHWGLAQAHLEAWGPFGKGWSLERFSAQIVEPQGIPLIGAPNAWSPGLAPGFVADVVYLDGSSEADWEKYTGKLKGAVVLARPPRQVQARFEPLAVRVTEPELLALANSDVGNRPFPGQARGQTAAERRAMLPGNLAGRAGGAATRPATQPTSSPANLGPTTRRGVPGRLMAFLMREGAGLVVTPSMQGDGGTLFVSAASLATPETRAATGPAGAPATVPTAFASMPRPWTVDSSGAPPQITLAAEDYNRLVRMIQQGEKLKMAVELKVRFHEEDPMAYNTIAEIPGTDLKDQIVMVGAHLDSWHSGTGATDNGAGVAAAMEAVRIIQALGLKPRRTIRIGLWTGEEEGLLGSKAYVTEHFGAYEERPGAAAQPTTRQAGRRGRGPTTRPATGAGAATARPVRKLVKKAEYERFSAYFNLDNGTGKIRGVYLQGNEAVRPIFRKWLAPFAEAEAQTLSLSNTGGTDHLSFDAIGLPGFQFIQDPIEYWSRTHHSNQDVFDRVQGEDLKQASTIMATFLYQAAMLDEKLPRKPIPQVLPTTRPAAQ